MTPTGIRQAVPHQKGEIAELWQTCFGEHREAVDYFLERVFAPEHCLVHIEDNRVVAMVHMLPARMVLDSGTVQAHYIYAAATDPGFRSRGLMGRLLEQAFSYGESRGDVCSFLLPSEPSLYDYYSRHGYVPYFSTRFAEITSAELVHIEPQETCLTELSADRLPQPEDTRVLRDAELTGNAGSILWPAAYLDYAAKVNHIYGGQTSALWERDGGLAGYALYSPMSDDRVEVAELFAGGESWRNMLKYIARQTGASRLRVRLPEHSTVLPGTGEIKAFGMARPLGGFVLPKSLAGRSPYLGLTLD